MEHILTHLKESLEDDVFSKAERKTLKSLIGDTPLDQQQLGFLRSKVFEMANERVTPENYQFIIEWIRNANGALVNRPQDPSDAFFSPGDACRNVIIQQIENANADLKICVFTISDDWITDSILRSHKRGVSVQIITDDDKTLDKGSDIRELAGIGIDVKIDNTPNHMHHKFMVADERVLLTGSYNWTLSAARYNHENILLTQEAGVVRSFLKEFGRLWKVMAPYS